MSKEVLFGKEAREKIIKGAKIMSDAVSSTLGPFGRNVIIKKEYSDPYVTKDGVTVANTIRLMDQLEDMGAISIRHAARKTHDNSGDGTTTTTLLSYKMLEYLSKLEIDSINDLKNVMQEVQNNLIDFIKSEKIPYDNINDMVRDVAMVSSNGDKELTDLICETFKEIGQFSDIIVETSPSLTDTHKTYKGFYFEGGYVSREFITDSKRGICEMDDVFIVMTDKKIKDDAEIYEIGAKILGAGKSLLLISPEVNGAALSMLIRTKQNKNQKICVIKTPGVNIRRAEMLEDIACYTGGNVVKEATGLPMNKILEGKKYVDFIGQCSKVVIRKDSTTIIGGKNDKERLDERVEYIKSQMADIEDTMLRERYEKRLAGLTGGVGAIFVGGYSDIEIKEKKDRVDDCIKAIKSSLSEGVVPGGGYIFSKYAAKIAKENPITGAISKALFSPMETIWEKNGNKKYPQHYYKYLQKNKIVDPIKVLIDCVRNSFSVAYSILSTNAVVINDKESNENMGDLPVFDNI